MALNPTGPLVIVERAGWALGCVVLTGIAAGFLGSDRVWAQTPAVGTATNSTFSPPPLPPADATSSDAVATQPEPGHWPWSGWFGGSDPVGSPKWWKKHKRSAEFHPGKGYAVEGVDGYFDGMGRPIDRPVSEASTPPPDSDVDPDKGLAPALDPRAVYGKVKSAVGLGPNDQVAHQMFLEGERLFEAKKYSAAAKEYASAADRAVDMRIKEDAMFMLAESYYFDDRCIPARDAYNALADKYPSTRYLDKLVEREWAIGRYLEAYANAHYDLPLSPNAWDKTRPWFDTMGHAIKTYENIRMNDPTGPRADDAIMATAGIYFRAKRYDDADYNYGLLRREYPRSEFQFEAHLLGLQSKLRKYQGADYDGTPLEEAQQLVKQLRTNFAGQLSAEERERLQTVSAQLHQELASRDMQMAQFYDGTKNYGSAKTYYAEVIDKYPDSELAQRAKQRMTELAGLPDFPEKRLAWFVDLFPKGQEHTALANVPEIKNGTLLAQPPATTTTR
jgi:outer membrane protein assembly factor BamD (BamD/ComL family)